MKISTKDIAWLAGILEGEGSFMLQKQKRYNGSIRIALQMTDKDIVERCAKLLDTKIYGPYISKQKKLDGTSKKETWYIHIFGSKAASWMMILFPLMGERRKNKIEELLIFWKSQQSMIPRMASCHPNLKMFSKNFCKSCYMKNWHRENKLAHTFD